MGSQETASHFVDVEDSRASSDDVLLLDDPNVVIPRKIARPIVWSSQLMLVTALFAALVNAWVIFGLSIGLYTTSTLFWRDPRVGFRRNADYVMVASSFGYGTLLACSLPSFYTAGWFIFLGVITVIFIVNESLFWRNKAKLTEWDYRRTVYVHLTGVHLIGNLAVWFVLFGIWRTGHPCCL